MAGVITPFGLYSAYEPVGERPGTFLYVPDKGPFGASTAPRKNYPLSRVCAWGHGAAKQPAPCPYSPNVASFDLSRNYTSAVSERVKEIYSSGTRGNRTTISNYADIEWRQLTTRNDQALDNGSTVAVGAFRQVESFLLQNEFKVVEGLIVDARSGGIGFRNHTLPIGAESGATWVEDLLFIEPVTACVDTNLTLDFTVSTNASVSVNGIKDLFLADRGGFFSLNRTSPSYNRGNPQVEPNLLSRAYEAAWLNNMYTMMFLNVTNPENSTTGSKGLTYIQSEAGKTFRLPVDAAGELHALGLSTQYGYYLFGAGSLPPGDSTQSNPFSISQGGNFSSICESHTCFDLVQ
jgi:hypothetical protein